MVQMFGWFRAAAARACGGTVPKPEGRAPLLGAGTSKPRSDVGDYLRLVDNTHPAAAELLDDAVVRDGLADDECGGKTRERPW